MPHLLRESLHRAHNKLTVAVLELDEKCFACPERQKILEALHSLDAELSRMQELLGHESTQCWLDDRHAGAYSADLAEWLQKLRATKGNPE